MRVLEALVPATGMCGMKVIRHLRDQGHVVVEAWVEHLGKSLWGRMKDRSPNTACLFLMKHVSIMVMDS